MGNFTKLWNAARGNGEWPEELLKQAKINPKLAQLVAKANQVGKAKSGLPPINWAQLIALILQILQLFVPAA